MELLWDGGMKFFSNGPGHMIKMAATPIYGKKPKKKKKKKNLLRNQKADDLESWYASLGAQVLPSLLRGARWLSGRVSDSGARGPGFETYRRRVVSLSKTLYSPKVLVNYPGSDGSVPT